MGKLTNELHCGDDQCKCARNQAVDLIEAQQAAIAASGNLASDMKELAHRSMMIKVTYQRGLVPTQTELQAVQNLEASMIKRLEVLSVAIDAGKAAGYETFAPEAFGRAKVQARG